MDRFPAQHPVQVLFATLSRHQTSSLVPSNVTPPLFYFFILFFFCTLLGWRMCTGSVWDVSLPFLSHRQKGGRSLGVPSRQLSIHLLEPWTAAATAIFCTGTSGGSHDLPHQTCSLLYSTSEFESWVIKKICTCLTSPSCQRAYCHISNVPCKWHESLIGFLLDWLLMWVHGGVVRGWMSTCLGSTLGRL